MDFQTILTTTRGHVDEVIAKATELIQHAHAVKVQANVEALAGSLPASKAAADAYVVALKAVTPKVPDVSKVNEAVLRLKTGVELALIESADDLEMAQSIVADWEARGTTVSSGKDVLNGKAFSAFMFQNGKAVGTSTCNAGKKSNTSRWNMLQKFDVGLNDADWVAMRPAVLQALEAGTNGVHEHGRLKIELKDKA